MTRWTLFAFGVVMLVAGAGIGSAATRTILVSRGQVAEFRQPSGWSCFHQGRTVDCHSGDALPYATLGVDRRVTALRVNSLSMPCTRRVRRHSPDPSDPMMKPYWEYIYTFKAFGCR